MGSALAPSDVVEIGGKFIEPPPDPTAAHQATLAPKVAPGLSRTETMASLPETAVGQFVAPWPTLIAVCSPDAVE